LAGSGDFTEKKGVLSSGKGNRRRAAEGDPTPLIVRYK